MSSRPKRPYFFGNVVARFIALAVFLSTGSSFTYADVWYVDKKNESGVQDGASWETAYTTLQPAIDAASEDGGGELWIAEGLYGEDRSDSEATMASLIVREDVDLYGGFKGSETTREARDWENNLTVVDGSTANSGEAAGRVAVARAPNIIDGLTITGGRMDSSNTIAPGGLAITGEGSIIRNCTFADNHSDGIGPGAVLVFNAESHVFENCKFIGNSVPRGRGGAIVGGELLIKDCIFENNLAMEGGAISVVRGQISGCTFFRNRAMGDGEFDGDGGAVFAVVDSSLDVLTIENCLFVDNSCNRRGGAIATRPFGNEDPIPILTVNVANSTFVGNSAGEAGRPSALMVHDSRLSVINSIFWNNQSLPSVGGSIDVQVSFSIVEGGFQGEGNLDLDPQFFDVGRGLFQLTEGSPAIDSGTADGAPDTDIEGKPRPFGLGFDMGAYEFDGTFPVQLTTAVMGEGTISPEAGDSFHPVGTAIELEATAAEGWGFSHWEGDLSGGTNPTEITLNADASVTAVFKQQFTLDTSVQGMGSIAPPAGSNVFLDGAVVNVLAMPADGWGFSHWEGDLAGMSNPMQITVDADKTVTAVFREEVTLTTEVQGMGTVEPFQGTFLDGDEVTLEASGAAGWMFDRWEGTLEGSPNPVTVIVDTDLHAAAVFTRIPNDCPTMPATTSTPPPTTLLLYGAVITAVAALGRRTRRT